MSILEWHGHPGAVLTAWPGHSTISLRGDFPSPALPGSGARGRHPAIAGRPLSLPGGPITGGLTLPGHLRGMAPSLVSQVMPVCPAPSAILGAERPDHEAFGPHWRARKEGDDSLGRHRLFRRKACRWRVSWCSPIVPMQGGGWPPGWSICGASRWSCSACGPVCCGSQPMTRPALAGPDFLSPHGSITGEHRRP